MVSWEYCKVETYVTDWSGAYGPRGITLRLFPSDPPIDFDDIDQALRLMGEYGWECFHIEISPPPIIMYRTTIMRFKRPKAN